MPLDAIFLGALKEELALQILGKKIDKVLQPERDLIILSLRGSGGQAHRLLISVGSEDTRIHLTGYRYENPKTPPMFCMLLRKHISGAEIKDITQPPGERVLAFKLESSDAMGIKSEKYLIVEMIGRRTNVILKGKNNMIIDCLRRIGYGVNDSRVVLPGLFYHDPPAQEGKLNPFYTTDEDLSNLIGNAADQTADKWLQSAFTAFSPLICREIAWRAYGATDISISRVKDDTEKLREAFYDIIRRVKNGSCEPWLITTSDNRMFDFSFTQIGQYEKKFTVRRENSFSDMLDKYYSRTAKEKRIEQKCASTLKAISTVRERLIRKIALQTAELEETKKRDHLRECGDLISANFHLIGKGQQLLSAEDFFSGSGGSREIILDKMKSPQQNAAKYYKAYSKAKNAEKFLTGLISNGEKELEYIDSVMEQLKRTETEEDLNEIRDELCSTGFIKQQKQTGRKQHKVKQDIAAPLSFLSSGGFKIFAGKNNLQNDKLTLKSSARTDLWFHAQKIHGSHVVISCAGTSPDKKTIQEAAAVAAYYSAARFSGKVPVDYTLVKNVKKPSGGRPGMVIYTDYQTIIANPDEILIEKLRDRS